MKFFCIDNVDWSWGIIIVVYDVCVGDDNVVVFVGFFDVFYRCGLGDGWDCCVVE